MNGSSLAFEAAPAIAPAHLKILLGRKQPFAGGGVPRIVAVLEQFAIDSHHVARYRRVYGDLMDLTAQFFRLQIRHRARFCGHSHAALPKSVHLHLPPFTLDVAFKRPISFRTRTFLESWMADRRMGFMPA